MALWLNRAGSRGQYEDRFLEQNRIYLTWNGLNTDLSKAKNKGDIASVLRVQYPEAPKGRISQNTGQLWSFVGRMSPGDWVALPSKQGPVIHIGEIVGDYEYDPNAEDPYYHSRRVQWLQLEIPRSHFDGDILASLGAFSTICQIKRNEAERRVKEMAEHNWRATAAPHPRVSDLSDETETGDSDEDEAIDLGAMGREQIAAHILAKYKGHPLARLVQVLLEAQGYTVYRSPDGPDQGIDLLASPSTLGFGSPRICVQVKSQESPLDRPTLDQLIGTMANVGADRGLLVCWGGFKSSIIKEKARMFFKVRLWDRDDLLDQIFENYDRLPESMHTELPLQRVWAMALPTDEEA